MFPVQAGGMSSDRTLATGNQIAHRHVGWYMEIEVGDQNFLYRQEKCNDVSHTGPGI